MKIDNYKFGYKGLKYELVKTILIYELLEKYKKNKYWISIYSELEYDSNTSCSVYVIDSKKKEETIYMIEELNKTYKFGNEKLVRLNLKKLSNNLEILNKQIKELI